MKLTLVRDTFGYGGTLGVLSVDGEYFCNTLEPCLGITEKYGKYGRGACIKPGTYSIDLHYSPKFKRYMLTLCAVPLRSGILIHSGNTVEDTQGCILVGVLHGSHLENSRKMLNCLFSKILCVLNKESVTITIKDK